MDAFERYEEIADDLVARNADVELTKMMGMPAIKAAGKLVGGFVRSADAMIFKLPAAEARERALALDGAALFDPMGGRPMREWVQVPAAHAADWPALAEQALALRRGRGVRTKSRPRIRSARFRHSRVTHACAFSR